MTSSPSPCVARLLAAACTAAVLAGCANVTEGQRNVMIGTGVGAAAGGLIGDGRGAAIGAAVGALGTYAWTQYMENKRRDMERVTAGTGIRVEQTADNQLKLSVPSDISFATNSAQIVSGLPLLSIPLPARRRILAAGMQALPAQGRLIQFTYALRAPSPWQQAGLQLLSRERVVFNLPPARVDVLAHPVQGSRWKAA